MAPATRRGRRRVVTRAALAPVRIALAVAVLASALVVAASLSPAAADPPLPNAGTGSPSDRPPRLAPESRFQVTPLTTPTATTPAPGTPPDGLIALPTPLVDPADLHPSPGATVSQPLPPESFRPNAPPPDDQPSSAPPPVPIGCDPNTPPVQLTAPNTDPRVTTAAFVGAPTYNELGLPPEPYTLRPKGYILIVHGGGWYEHGPIKVQQLRGEANLWRTRGWATLNITYRPCSQSIGDVFWYYLQLRHWARTDVPICAMGQSSGAHLVLLLAGLFADLDCAISQAGPLDLVGMPRQLAYDDLTDDDGDAPPEGPLQAAWPRWAYAVATGVFGEPPGVWFASPLTWAGEVHARLLIATAADDRVIPLDQGRNYAAAVLAGHPDAYVDVDELPQPPAGAPASAFVHGSTTLDAWADYRAREEALVAPLVGTAELAETAHRRCGCRQSQRR